MKFREKLQRLLAEKNLTVYQLAAATGIYHATIGRWLNEKHKAHPKPEALASIASVFSVDMNWLSSDDYGWDDRPEYDAETFWLARVIQLAYKVGPKEAAERLAFALADEDVTIKTPGAKLDLPSTPKPPRPPKRKSL